MWNDLVKNLSDYTSAVLTGIDETGYPFSMRCKPEPDGATRELRVQVPKSIGIQLGPACLLCHKHDELGWNVKSFNVFGILEQDDEGWILRPLRFTRGLASDLVGSLRFMRYGRRNAKRYLRRRGLPRPEIPWDKIRAGWAETRKQKIGNK